MRVSPLPFVLLVAACLALLPVVHPLIDHGQVAPVFVIILGGLAMGLAWAGGCSLQRRRRKTVFGLAAGGIVVPLGFLLPPFADTVGGWPTALLLLGSGLSLAGLLALRRVYA